MSTKPDPCYEKAAPDEPLFVLRAQDLTAPETVEHWLKINPQLRGSDKGFEAQKLIEQMRRWQTQHACKMPD